MTEYQSDVRDNISAKMVMSSLHICAIEHIYCLHFECLLLRFAFHSHTVDKSQLQEHIVVNAVTSIE